MTNLQKFDIITLIEKDSKTRLSQEYQNTLINKIKETFSAEEQQLFVASFYCYLNYDSKKDFVIDFTNVWKWCGFSRKSDAKKVLERHFVLDIDYNVDNDASAIAAAKIDSENKTDNFAAAIAAAKSIDEDKGHTKYDPRGGYNKEKITLTVNTFKKFCMKTGTKKSDQIHDYYVKLEELFQETLKSQSDELQKQLLFQQEALEASKKEIEKLTKRYIKPVKPIYEDKNVVYLTTSDEGKKNNLYSIGKSIDLSERIYDGYNGNKIHNFEVIYYIPCRTIELMDLTESCILTALSKYKYSTRDVFELPADKNISLFTDVFDLFAKIFIDVDGKNVKYPSRTKKPREPNADDVSQYRKAYYDENIEELSQYKKDYYLENKEELIQKSNEYYEENKIEINNRAKEYYEDHKEDFSERGKIYRLENKEKISQVNKKYRDENKEKIAENLKIYKEEHKEELKEKRQEKILCECGKFITKQCLRQHKNSKIHEIAMKLKNPVVDV
jgi:hypothetical protein